MLYIIYDEVDQKDWILLEAESDRAAKRIMRQSILAYQKDVDFEFTLRGPSPLPDSQKLNVICSSDDLFKSDDDIEEKEVNV